jgi:hypothetical protein
MPSALPILRAPHYGPLYDRCPLFSIICIHLLKCSCRKSFSVSSRLVVACSSPFLVTLNILGLLSSGTGYNAVWPVRKSAHVSDQHVAFIFRVEEWAKEVSSMKQVASRAADRTFHNRLCENLKSYIKMLLAFVSSTTVTFRNHTNLLLAMCATRADVLYSCISWLHLQIKIVGTSLYVQN